MATEKFKSVTMADLITSVLETEESAPVSKVVELWDKNPQVDGMAVVGGGHVRYLSRARFFVQLGKRFGYSLFEHRPVSLLAEEGATVEADMDPVEVVALATQREPEKVYDDLLVVDGRRFCGLVSMRSLLVHHKSLLAAGIAERAALEERNRRLEERGSVGREFIAELARQVRAPLDAVLGLSRRLLADTEESDPRWDITRALLGRGLEALSVVNELQDVAMIEQGGMEPLHEMTVLAPLFDEAVREAQAMIAGRPLRIEVDTTGAPERFPTDPVFLKRVLSHLLSGTIRGVSEGHLGFQASSRPEGLSLWVRWEGEGSRPQTGETTRGGQGAAPFEALKGLLDIVGGRLEARAGERGALVILSPGAAPSGEAAPG